MVITNRNNNKMMMNIEPKLLIDH